MVLGRVKDDAVPGCMVHEVLQDAGLELGAAQVRAARGGADGEGVAIHSDDRYVRSALAHVRDKERALFALGVPQQGRGGLVDGPDARVARLFGHGDAGPALGIVEVGGHGNQDAGYAFAGEFLGVVQAPAQKEGFHFPGGPDPSVLVHDGGNVSFAAGAFGEGAYPFGMDAAHAHGRPAEDGLGRVALFEAHGGGGAELAVFVRDGYDLALCVLVGCRGRAVAQVDGDDAAFGVRRVRIDHAGRGVYCFRVRDGGRGARVRRGRGVLARASGASFCRHAGWGIGVELCTHGLAFLSCLRFFRGRGPVSRDGHQHWPPRAAVAHEAGSVDFDDSSFLGRVARLVDADGVVQGVVQALRARHRGHP